MPAIDRSLCGCRYDIEEIVKDNVANHVCPFHATRDLMTGGGDEKEGWSAALILITYTQLINVCVREVSLQWNES